MGVGSTDLKQWCSIYCQVVIKAVRKCEVGEVTECVCGGVGQFCFREGNQDPSEEVNKVRHEPGEFAWEETARRGTSQG